MKQFLFFLIFMMFNPLVMSQTLKLDQLEGKWLVYRSNFPMWLKGDKINPTFNYSIISRNGKSVLLDEVCYIQKSKTKSITGYDKSINEDNNRFIWHGKGILSLVKSKWSILYFDSENEWMVIHFEKTLFTPEGYDVVSRSRIIDLESEQEILKKLSELGVNETLTLIHQE